MKFLLWSTGLLRKITQGKFEEMLEFPNLVLSYHLFERRLRKYDGNPVWADFSDPKVVKVSVMKTAMSRMCWTWWTILWFQDFKSWAGILSLFPWEKWWISRIAAGLTVPVGHLPVRRWRQHLVNFSGAMKKISFEWELMYTRMAAVVASK